MAQKTDLNVAPYYDDFTESDNFNKTLFRPGFAVQARELTQLQSVLQNQIEKQGAHIFEEGAMVIPGRLNVNLKHYSLKLASSFGSETIDPSQYYNATTPVTITGATTGVTAVVVGYDVATATDQPTLYLRYLSVGSDYATAVFADGENISANAGITHTTSYSADAASATTYTSTFSVAAGSAKSDLESATGPASRTGCSVRVEDGVYYIRGFFVTCSAETYVLDKYTNTPSYRVGFTITETLLTPESDSSLLDNATGSSNFAAKGAHRLKVSLALSKLARTSTSDSTFVQLMDIKEGVIQSMVRATEYSVLEETLARRTLDESGNYTVRPYQFVAKESVTLNKNVGVFTAGDDTDDGNTASTSLLALQISPGKAYVGGHEIENMAPTFKDINKARDFNTVNAGISVFDLGNYAFITNIYGAPDVTYISGEATAFKKIELYDDVISTRGSATGSLIGVARARSMEYYSGAAGATSSNTSSVYKLYLFDIRPFTKLVLSGTPSPTLLASHANGGVFVTGNTSGATGFVYASGTSGTSVNLTNVTGTFQAGEKIKASDSAETGLLIEDSGNTDLTVSEATTFNFSDIRSVYMQDPDSGQDFTADCVLEVLSGEEGAIVLDGTDASSADVNGTIVLDASGSGTEDEFGELLLESQKVARLKDTEKNRAIFKLQKRVVKTLLTDDNDGASDTQYTVRRQFVGTTNASGVVTFTAGSNETFASHAEKDYTMSILTAGDGSGSQGDLVSTSGKVAGAGTTSFTITDATALGNGAKVKLFATLLKTSVTQKAKTTNLMKHVKVSTGATDAYGTRPDDKTISLGRADVFNLAAVYDSEDTGTDAVAPTLTVGTITGTFTRGEKITGSASGATGRVVGTSSPISYVSTSVAAFNTSDTITGDSSGATAVVSAVTVGDEVITSRYELDTGQRDNFYDIARIVRKPGRTAPTGKVLIIHDYLEHGSGDFMSVDSYTDVAKQMEYEDIPTYTATKVDPDAPKPSGQFPLYDTYDFRPRVEDIAGASSTLATVDEITGNSFDFYSRQFDGTGSSTVDVNKPGSNIQSDFEYYLPKRAVATMNSNGSISITEGLGAEIPQIPKVPDGTMKLCEMYIPAYTFVPSDVTIRRERNQRFTMADIGKLETRLDHVEYYTALNMLERDAESYEVTDVNGLSRFKSGFVVDNFSGHRVGDASHKDYKCSMDMEKGELRPVHKTKAIKLEESVSTTGERVSAGYQKTGDLITLPYTEETYQEQPFCTRVERCAPFLQSEWVGKITLSPDGDEWFESEIAPELVINVEGNFDAVTAAAQNQIGTIWNAWQTQWSGVVGRSTQGLHQNNNPNNMIDRDVTIITTRSDQTRTGIRTGVAEQIDRESQGFRVISRALIPIMRSNTITFTGIGFRPNTRLYGFFDKVNVNAHITPASTTFTSDTTPAAASPLITNAAGSIQGTFLIPDPKIEGNLRFLTGEVQFRLTSSSTNSVGSTQSALGGSTEIGLADVLTTAADAIYFAKGILETEQETIIATRNAIIAQTTVNQSRSITSQSSTVTRRVQSNDTENSEPSGDPLAQTFMVEGLPTVTNAGGRFLTSIDVFFAAKDDTLPVTMEIRNVVNGYPGPKVLPFGRKTLESSEVNIDASTGATATTFTFPSPVYVKEGMEYCVALIPAGGSPEYTVWISRMGETEATGTRTISDQPHIGILFKSHNNTGWAMSPMEDLKFVIKTASFTTNTTGTVTLQNTDLDAKTLDANSILITDNSTTTKVKHRDHHMYATTNNVTIAGVVSGASTTLNGAITDTATTLTLTSGTNFDDTSGKYSRTADGTPLWYIKIDDEIMYYTTISTNAVSVLTRGAGGTTAAAHSDGATVELYQIHKVPLTEINKTHTSIANIEIDSYTITLTTTPVVDGSGGTAELGGSSITATENAIMGEAHTIVGNMELPNTTIGASIRPTTATSPDGTQTSFSTTSAANAKAIPLNDNYSFGDIGPHMVCSSINETNELSGVKSLFVPVTLISTAANVSPVIDTQRMSLLTVANRLDNVDSSSDVYPTTDYIVSTEPAGDNNAAIYLTKKVVLENSATALKIIFAAHRPSTSEIKLLYKILRTDDASDFDDLGYTYFNTTGVPDVTVGSSGDEFDFSEYVYTAGVTDDGIGTPLDEFISFQIKIVMQGTNCATPPRIRDFRALALVT